MFIAIVIPQARQEKSMLLCMGIALVLSCMFTWLPWLKSISSGLAIVLCTVITAAICAVIFPIEEDEK
jgi:predicted branched-subunit amino acid permease